MKIVLFFLIVLLSACGMQRKMAEAAKKANAAIELAKKEEAKIKSINQIATRKLGYSEMDSTIKNEYDNVLAALDKDVIKIREKSDFVQNALNSKADFRRKKSLTLINQELATIDSFNAKMQSRQRIYDMITDAVNTKAFNLFNLAAFFDPGVYKVPSGALERIRNSFKPALDSMLLLKEQYADIPSKGYIVFVGYADASAVGEGTSLYNELSQYVKTEHPSSNDLNMVLSDLRAKELMENMKMVITNSESLPKNYSVLNISYSGYGKGEILPFAHIKDYKEDDERRRIVLFYWALLPDISIFKN